MSSSTIVEPSTAPSQIFSSFTSDKFPFSSKLSDGPTVAYTTIAIVITLLILEQTVYRSKKGSLPGDKWSIPIIGKFADSLNPTLENYKKQWAMGELSALSVFNM